MHAAMVVQELQVPRFERVINPELVAAEHLDEPGKGLDAEGDAQMMYAWTDH